MSKFTLKVLLMAIIAMAMPAIALANGGSKDTLLTEHWGDLPIFLLVAVSTIFAVLAARIYGGIIGAALKLISVGLVGVIIHKLMETVEHFGVDIISHSTGITLEIIGFGIIAFGFFKLYRETKNSVGK